MMMVAPSAPGRRPPVLVLVAILPLWDLDPSELRIAFKHLSFSLPLSLFCCFQQGFCQLRQALTLYFILYYFYQLKSPVEALRGPAEVNQSFFSLRFFAIHYIC